MYKYFVKCDDIFELKKLSNLGRAGLPYVQEWAPSNLEQRKIFPVYVDITQNTDYGIILNEIKEITPSNKLSKIITYNKFLNTFPEL